jgi:GYF domain 2/Domain of unknown function (DUF4328)
MDEWFYKRNDGVFGPISSANLIQLLRRGSLGGDTLVRRSEEDEWMPLARIDFSIAMVEETPNASQGIQKRSSASSPPIYLWLCSILAILIIALGSLNLLVYIGMDLALLWLPDDIPKEFKELIVVADRAKPWLLLFFYCGLMIWHAAAFASVRRFYELGAIRRSPWSCFWWITPFANFIIPFQCLAELASFSQIKTREQSRRPDGIKVLIWIMGASFVILWATGVLFGLFIKLNRGHEFSLTAAYDSALLPFGIITCCLRLTIYSSLAVFIVLNLIHQVRMYKTQSI